MAFTPISSRLSSLPRLIVGPILRGVTSFKVTVMIVTRVPVETQLNVYNWADDPATDPAVFTGTMTSSRIGANFYISYIDASNPDPQVSLFNGAQYKYNINFTSVDGVPSTKTLLDLDSDKQVDFTDYLYDGHTLPNFVMDPYDLTKRKIVHGSCRKPHGEWTDCMFALDKMIQDAVDSNDIDNRPNLLFLTGDQIYADDVSDQLLFLLRDAGKAMIDIGEKVDISDLIEDIDNIKRNLEKSEILNIGGGSFDIAYNNLNLENGNNQLVLDNLIPGIRGPYIHASHLTVDSKFKKRHMNIAKSHLIALEEFMMMYAFVWSDVLWPAFADFPTYSEVYNGKLLESYSANLTGNRLYKYGANQLDKDLKEGVDTVASQIGARTYYKDQFDEYEPRLRKFMEGLKNVRRAMAHVPTYMMFDDHEVTDDLFLNRPWVANTCNEDPTDRLRDFETKKILKPTNLSRRVISNGMTALTIFQMWGNNVSSFDSDWGYVKISNQDPLNLLNFIDDQITNNSSNFDFSQLENRLLPRLVPSDDPYEHRKLDFFYDYSFVINSYDKTAIILLDTRTKRAFPKNIRFLNEVVPMSSPKRRVSRLDSPAGLINKSEITRIMKNININSSQDIALIISPAPVIGHELLEPMLGDVFGYASSTPTITEDLDFEAWGYNRNSKEHLLNELKKFDQVIFLSGDVHYGFSIEGKYWDDSDPNNKKKYSFAQLTSTSMKNRTFMTALMQLLPTPEMYHLKWSTNGNHVKNADIAAWLQSWFLPNAEKKKLPPLEFVEWNKQPLKYPYVFDAMRSNLADYYNASNLTRATEAAGEIWDAVTSDWSEMLDTYNELVEFYERWSGVYEWVMNNYETLQTIVDDMEIYMDQLRTDWDTIVANWPMTASEAASIVPYWVNEKYTWLYQNYDFLSEHWQNLNDYWDQIIYFFNSPVEIQLTSPINMYYEIVNKPEVYYRTKTIEDTRSARLDEAIYTNLDTLLDFKEINGPVTAEDLKFQKVSIWGHIKWGGFVGSKVVGTNNMCEVTFPNWDTNSKQVLQKFWADVLEYQYDEGSGYLIKQPEPVTSPSYQKFLKPWTHHTIDLNTPTNDDIPMILR